MEFSNSMENLVAATSLEIRRGGPVFVPTLEGVPRIEKPPLTAWITSLAIGDETMRSLDSSDAATRDAAYRTLAVQVRWPALLASCLSLFAVYSLGQTVFDARAGLISMVVCASSYFFLRFARNSTTDVQLMLWVAVANAFLARMILDRVTWRNAVGAGASIGLAFMSKGPVALVQTVVPALGFVGWRWWSIRRDAKALPRREGGSDVTSNTPGQSASVAPDTVDSTRNLLQHNSLAIFLSTLVAISISLWWFLAVGIHNPAIVHRWLSETNPAGGERISSNNFAQYLVIIPFMLPWAVFLIDGLIRIVIESKQQLTRGMYIIVLFAGAILIMTCFHDRKDRYILPLVGVASVIAARGVVAMLDREHHSIPIIVHWITLAIMACIPLAGLTTSIVKTREGVPWFTPRFAIMATVIGLVVIAIGIILSRRSRLAAVFCAFALMMLLQAVGIHGYIASREGRSEMKPLADAIRAAVPGAEMFNYRSDGLQKRVSVDLSIYLNRGTRWIADPSLIPVATHPQIYITLQNRGEPDPLPAPGWKYFDRVKRDKDWYVAFVRAQALR